MTHAILIQNKVAAQDIGSYNRSAVSGSEVGSTDMDNGFVFRLDTQSSTTGLSEVWLATSPSTTASTNDNLWMCYSPEIVVTTAGTKQFKGIDVDPQDFYVPGFTVFDAFKPQVGDILTMTADAFYNSKSSNAFANSAAATYKLVWGSSQTASALSLAYLATTYVSVGSGAIDSQRITAYKMVVIAN